MVLDPKLTSGHQGDPGFGVTGQGRQPRSHRLQLSLSSSCAESADPGQKPAPRSSHVSQMLGCKLLCLFAAVSNHLTPTTQQRCPTHRTRVQEKVGGLGDAEEAALSEEQSQRLRPCSPAVATELEAPEHPGVAGGDTGTSQPSSSRGAQGPRSLGSHRSGSWDPNPPASETPLTSAPQPPTQSNRAREPDHTGRGRGA